MKFLKITDKDGKIISYYNLNNIINLTKYQNCDKGYGATENDFRIQLKLSNGEVVSTSTVAVKIEIVEDISLYEI